jgi:LmbE family N-acetylglucosaminyl deacetylase
VSLPLPDGRSTRVAGIFAHPDDETFFAGAAFATYAALGCEVRLATLTGGEVFGPVQLEKYGRACTELGAASGTHLRPGRWQDLGRSGTAESLAAAPLGEVVEAIAEFVEAYEPHVLITNDAGGVTGHPDHVRAHEAVLAARGDARVVLAGCLRATDVSSALERLGALAPGRSIGSGGVSGVEVDVLELEPSKQATRSRAAALDAYYPGLGSQPLDDLVDPAGRVGDGVVLRAIADAAGHREFFRVL